MPTIDPILPPSKKPLSSVLSSGKDTSLARDRFAAEQLSQVNPSPRPLYKPTQSSPAEVVEEVHYMDLGGQSHREQGDIFTHEQILPPERKIGEPDVYDKHNAPVEAPRLSFALVKSYVEGPHSTKAYVLWVLLALLIGISIASFITQSAFFVYDKVAHPGATELATSDSANTFVKPLHATSSEALGSDDASRGSIADQYRVSNIESLAKQNILAKAYLVADINTGEVLFEKNNGFTSPMASVSKLMTAVVTLEKVDPEKVAIVSRDSYGTYGSEGGLLLGEKLRVRDLMYPLLMESSNDGAEVLADAYGHDVFIAELNKKAKDLGMTDTYYQDPSGLSPQNISTVDDLLKLAMYVNEKHPTIWDISRVKQYAILKHIWVNKNNQLKYDSFVGGKNGYIDEARKTTVSLFNTDVAHGGKRPLVIVLLRTDDREGDIAKILKFLAKNAYYDVGGVSAVATSTADGTVK